MDINKYTPKFKAARKDLLHLADMPAEEIFEFLYTAKLFKKKFKVGENAPVLKDKTIALLFGSASTRTRVAFEMGIRQLGGDYVFLPKNETQLSRGESIKDTAAMLGRYGLAALVLRGFPTRRRANLPNGAKCPSSTAFQTARTLCRCWQTCSPSGKSKAGWTT